MDLQATFRRIYYNYAWAFVYNLLMVPLAAGVLFPPLHFQLPPWVRASTWPLFKCLCSLFHNLMVVLPCRELSYVLVFRSWIERASF